MKQLVITAAFACLLAACGPASPPAEDASSSEQTPEQRAASVPAMDAGAPDPMEGSERAGAVWADVATTDLIPGVWRYSTDANAGYHRAAYGAADDEGFDYFVWVCTPGSSHSVVAVGMELPRDQPTGFGFLTPTARYVFAGESSGSGTDMPNISADISIDDPRLDVIAASESFAYQVAGYTPRIPGDPMLARVLAECRGTS